jgi:ferredoxin-thioredoxin reductase catalytic chain
MKKAFIYSNYFCQACRRLKDFLRGHDVPFDYVDLDRLSGEHYKIQSDRAYRLSGSRALPIVQVGEEVRVGFDPEWLSHILDVPDAEMAPSFSGERWTADPALEPRRTILRMMFDPLVRVLGYKFTPDREEAESLLEQVARNETIFGMPFCPCKTLSDNRDQDLKIVCPCIPFHRKHFDSMKRCWCGLFVHQDVEEPRRLKQVPKEEEKNLT